MNSIRQIALAYAVEVTKYVRRDHHVFDVAAVFLDFLEDDATAGATGGCEPALGHAVRRHLDRTNEHLDWANPRLMAGEIVATAREYVAFMDEPTPTRHARRPQAASPATVGGSA